MSNLGITIRKLRKQMHLTQADLAYKVNKSESAIRMWELGKSQPDNDTLLLLSELFNVSVDYLLGNDIKRNRSTEAYDFEQNVKRLDENVNIVFNDLASLDDDDFEQFKQFYEFIKSKKKK
jgi:transcriptional regulator with XRE-family HTH domain